MLVSKAQQRINGLAGFVVLSLLGATVSAFVTPAPVVTARPQPKQMRVIQVSDAGTVQVVRLRAVSCLETRNN